ncbi:hypothetical protein [uncultured Friedmanniella sp.]|uniref:hypothetical protein n=1 Tax=uncultured Friedmanniella sp. TaxID=335381 RepID=UPI0035CAC82C
MQVGDLLLAMRRRWYLVLAVVLVAVAATLGTVWLVGPTYEAKGAMLLIPPGATVQQRLGTGASTGNPYLALSGLTQARDVVIRSVGAQATRLEICERSGDAAYEAMRKDLCLGRPTISYEVTPDFDSSAPVVLVTVEADTAMDAVTALTVVMDQVPVALTDLQSSLNLRPKTSITSISVMADRVPQVVRKDQVRAGVVAGGGVLAVGILLIGLIDGTFSTMWERRRSHRERPVPDWGLNSEADNGWTLPAISDADSVEHSAQGWILPANSPLPSGQEGETTAGGGSTDGAPLNGRRLVQRR